MVTATLHPARARRMREKLPPRPHHAVELRPLGTNVPGECIVSYSGDDFIDALMADLQADDWQSRLARRRNVRRRRGSGRLELSPPVHRTFQLCLFEVHCMTPGLPPVDPKKVVGSGLVVRRRAEDGRDLAWKKAGEEVLGWSAVTGEGDLDPDPLQRHAVAANAAELTRIVAEHRRRNDMHREELHPLQVAPPEVCRARGKTILFGLVPVASDERAPGNEARVDFAAGGTDPQSNPYVGTLSPYLRRRGSISMPYAGEALAPTAFVPGLVRAGMNPLAASAKGVTLDERRYHELGLFLQQLSVQVDLFGTSHGAAEARAVLAGLDLPMRVDEFGRVVATMPALDWIGKAIPLLLEQKPVAGGLTMPLSWPAIDDRTGDALTAAALKGLTTTFDSFHSDATRFEGRDWLYRARGFVRLSHGPDCPVRLAWSDYSKPFHIAPWWDSDGPPTKIALPVLGDLRSIKPNVAFEMPPELAALMNRDPLDSLKGEGGEPSKIGLGWLCSFSLPIITLCAFIVLNIFLSLFNLFFHWMLWIKICLPIPAPQPASNEGGP